MRYVLCLPLLVVIAACGMGPADEGRSAVATLTPVALPTDPPWHVKSEGEVMSLSGRSLRVRVGSGPVHREDPLAGALIALRVNDRTSFQLRAADLADIHVGDDVTFAFDPRTLDPSDGSYLAKVLGRR
jgi:hypothetical protein